MKCTFFGHADTSETVLPKLEAALIDLIENKNADTFYVGNHGNFDRMVRNILKRLKLTYPHINYAVVLAYIPGKKQNADEEDHAVTVYPEGLESIPPKYAIDKRNRWMINCSDCVIAYVTHGFGGAAKYKELALKQGKAVINLAVDDNK